MPEISVLSNKKAGYLTSAMVFDSLTRRANSMPDTNVSTITVDYRIIDGWHVFTSADVHGLYVANENQEAAFNAVGPTIETLLQLNENVRVEVRPAITFARFLEQMRGHSAHSMPSPGSSQFVVFSANS
jgi:hypothetical protein